MVSHRIPEDNVLSILWFGGKIVPLIGNAMPGPDDVICIYEHVSNTTISEENYPYVEYYAAVAQLHSEDNPIVTGPAFGAFKTINLQNIQSNQVKRLTGYAMGSSVSAISTADSLNTAIGKLERMAKRDVPLGAILLWSGNIADIPEGWHLCDGNTPNSCPYTIPDLRDRFVVGAGSGYNVGDTGGAASVRLTAAESGLPAHSHSFTYVTEHSGSTTYPNITSRGSDSPSTSNNTIGSTGGSSASQAHENRPPYYALAYIMHIGTSSDWNENNQSDMTPSDER